MDIRSKAGWPASALSNFAPHPFVIDGIQCNSMEGFLQSLKFKNPDMQEAVCKLVGIKAKRRGKNKNWQTSQILFWRGKEILRQAPEYQELLDRAFVALGTQNESFRNALKATGNAVLTHTMGRTDKSETVLTQTEFCGRLMRLRQTLFGKIVT